jgi:hypothetical protein
MYTAPAFPPPPPPPLPVAWRAAVACFRDCDNDDISVVGGAKMNAAAARVRENVAVCSFALFCAPTADWRWRLLTFRLSFHLNASEI